MEMTFLRRAGDWIARFCIVLSATCLLLIMCVTVVEVVGRYLLNAPIFGRQDITQILLALSIFFAFPGVTLRGEQIDVDLMDFMFSARMATIRDRLIELIMAISMLTMGYWLFIRAEKVFNRGITSEMLFIPKYPLIFLIAGIVTVTGFAKLFLMLVRTFKGTSTTDQDTEGTR